MLGNIIKTGLGFLLFFCAASAVSFAQSKTQKPRPKPAPAIDRPADDQDEDYGQLRQKATELISQNRYIDALPLLEKIAKKFPRDAEIMAHYGIARLARAVTLTDETRRKAEGSKAGDILIIAKSLGTKNVIALQYADIVERGGELDSVFSASSKEVENAIREGEGFFSSGEFAKARESYERAYKLDPKNYEAVLFIGDCYYSEKKYAESEPWFAKAVALEPNREQAYRFWGDALMFQGKTNEALSKFADAVIADPSSRLTWKQFLDWVSEHSERNGSPFVTLPGATDDDIVRLAVKPEFLQIEDGTSNWEKYIETRKLQDSRSNNSDDQDYEPSIAEEVAALKKVIAGVKADRDAGAVKKLHTGLANLIRLDETNLLDAYVLMFAHGASNCREYAEFRKGSRDKLRRLLTEHVAGLKL